jgi:hypothetical protein
MTRSARRLHEALLAAALLWIAVPSFDAGAVPIQITITGEVTDVSSVIAAAFSPGQTMSATFVYDSGTPPVLSPIPTQALYPGTLSGGAFTIDGYAGTSAGGTISVANDDSTFSDRLNFANVGITAASVGTHVPFLFQILLHDSAQLALGTTDLPLTLPGVGAFTEASWMLAFTPVALVGEQTGVRGRLLSVTLTPRAVPEPPQVALLVVAVAAGTLVLRRGGGLA